MIIHKHGKLELTSIMGDDLTPVKMARVSLGGSEYEDEKRNDKLLKYLWEHKHHTPFEHVCFTFYVKAPIFVARQWFRHRIGSFSEVSGRYTEIKDEYYLPERWRKQSKDNKQGSDGEFPDKVNSLFTKSYHMVVEPAIGFYNELIDFGVAREQARMVLPQSMYTEFIWTVNLRSLFNFLELRCDQHAQAEIRVYAEAIKQILNEKIPKCIELLEN